MPITDGYVTLAQLKHHVEAFEAATDHDAELERAAEAASRAIDNYCGRSFLASQTATPRLYRARDPYLIDVRDFWSTDDLQIATDTDDDGIFETAWVADQYQVEPLDPDDGWPWRWIAAIDAETFPCTRRVSVRVTAKWGWAEVPKEVEATCLIVAGELWARKRAPFGVTGFSGPADPARISASELPALSRLDGYRRVT